MRRGKKRRARAPDLARRAKPHGRRRGLTLLAHCLLFLFGRRGPAGVSVRGRKKAPRGCDDDLRCSQLLQQPCRYGALAALADAVGARSVGLFLLGLRLGDLGRVRHHPPLQRVLDPQCQKETHTQKTVECKSRSVCTSSCHARASTPVCLRVPAQLPREAGGQAGALYCCRHWHTDAQGVLARKRQNK
jgi:hypothetical protein